VLPVRFLGSSRCPFTCDHCFVCRRLVAWGEFTLIRISQGISIGNAGERLLSEIMKDYPASAHHICGPLVRGGLALLAQELGYVSAARV